MANFFIKENYKVNLTSDNQPVDRYTEVPSSLVYQVPVYKYAQTIVRKKEGDSNSVLELGSGSGYKLVKYISPFSKKVYGLDQKHATDYCKKKYDVCNWVTEDFESPDNFSESKFDVIICADVIEHLIDPIILLKKIRSYSSTTTDIIISTPERDLVRGEDSYGPPENLLHVREWNKNEFKLFIEDNGFVIENHLLLEAKSLSLKEKVNKTFSPSKYKTCQMVHCKLA